VFGQKKLYLCRYAINVSVELADWYGMKADFSATISFSGEFYCCIVKVVFK